MVTLDKEFTEEELTFRGKVYESQYLRVFYFGELHTFTCAGVERYHGQRMLMYESDEIKLPCTIMEGLTARTKAREYEQDVGEDM